MLTTNEIQVQGRTLSGAELAGLQQWIYQHWEWSQNRLARCLCQQWDWRAPTGQLKRFAGWSLLRKLEARYGLVLPPVRVAYRRARPWGLEPAGQRPVAPTPWVGEVSGLLGAVQPLAWELAPHGSAVRARALTLLRQHHYLGCNRPVGGRTCCMWCERRQGGNWRCNWWARRLGTARRATGISGGVRSSGARSCSGWPTTAGF